MLAYYPVPERPIHGFAGPFPCIVSSHDLDSHHLILRKLDGDSGLKIVRVHGRRCGAVCTVQQEYFKAVGVLSAVKSFKTVAVIIVEL